MRDDTTRDDGRTDSDVDRVRVVFVDDDPTLLADLEDMLRDDRTAWDMVFVDSGTAALEHIAANPVDLVVSDMAMPGMDGAELLAEVRRIRPSTARVILSGPSDGDATLRASTVAHQFLDKPCDRTAITTVVARVDRCRHGVTSDRVREIIGSLDRLPSPGGTHQRLRTALADDAGIAELANVLSQDVASTAELLRLVNTAFFGLPRRVGSVAEAISFLGVDLVSAVVVSESLFAGDRSSSVDLVELNRHSAATADLAGRVERHRGGSTRECADAYVAGMLHDVGVLVLAELDTVGSFGPLMDALSMDDVMVERLIFDADRFAVAGHLLGLWGFSDEVVGSVADLGTRADPAERASSLRIAHEALVSADVSAADVAGLTPDEVEAIVARVDRSLVAHGR